MSQVLRMVEAGRWWVRGDGMRRFKRLEGPSPFRIESRAMASIQDIEAYVHSELAVAQFKDYGPNGLQVEGQGEVLKLVSGVTASLALIEAAVDAGANALLVHHGLFWRGHDGRLTGWLKRRVQALMAHGVHLLAYHLPLDAHPSLGNNAQLGRLLGVDAEPKSRFGDQSLGWLGQWAQPLSLPALGDRLSRALGREPLLVPGDGRPLRQVAWCTGGAQGYFEAAVAAGADVFITGEISEPQAHWARETGVAFVACGHHASERYGVQALGEHLAQHFGLQHQFIDIDNPA
jgi:dinuclear metal center YbgI/SA1388 family protein